MKRKSKIDTVENCIVSLRDGTRWKVTSFDELTVKGWSTFDQIESETFGINRGLQNLTRTKKVSADPI